MLLFPQFTLGLFQVVCHGRLVFFKDEDIVRLAENSFKTNLGFTQKCSGTLEILNESLLVSHWSNEGHE